MKQNGVTELSIEQPEFKVSIKRGGSAGHQAAEAHQGAQEEPAAGALRLQPVEVLAHLVGIFHHGDGADPASVARAGRQVAAGQVLGSIEAMKVRNEVRSPVSGRVSEVLVGEGAAVQYGQVLFRVEPEMERTDESLAADAE